MFTISALREFRILDYAIFDLALAFVGMALLGPPLTWFFKKIRVRIPFWSWQIWALPIGILTHIIIGRDTLMTQRFLDPSGHYLLKIFLLTLFLLGWFGVRRIKIQPTASPSRR